MVMRCTGDLASFARLAAFWRFNADLIAATSEATLRAEGVRRAGRPPDPTDGLTRGRVEACLVLGMGGAR